MPLVSMSGPQALATRKANTVAHWGNRNLENRVEPITKPAFDVPFKLKKGEEIFTIGSCFARNVEAELAAKGFRIPMRDLFKTNAFEGLDTEIVNNFGTPSIYNELAWAFGEQEFREEDGFVELAPGKFVDLQMVPSVRPAPLELVRARRQGLLEATRQMARCRVVIMTLGLVELWWDEQAGLYLNSSPLPSILHNAPDRFSLHVLSFEDCHRYLRSAFEVMFRHGRKDLRVILTVSPVPMMATHRRTDVITANCYSKSVLRAVAEHLVEQDERIVYFPSYETVMLSHRQASWTDDLVHVTRPMVAFNVERLLSHFMNGGEPAELALPDIVMDESADAILLAEQARRARSQQDEQFFEKHKTQAARSPRFALEYARFLFEQKRHRSALEVLGDSDSGEAQWLRADIHMALEQYDHVLRIAETLRQADIKGIAHWRLMLDVHVARKNRQGILDVESLWGETQPATEMLKHVHVGRALRKLGAHSAAAGRLEKATDDPNLKASARLELARALIGGNAPGRAMKVLKEITPENPDQARQVKQLRDSARRKRRSLLDKKKQKGAAKPKAS